MPAGSVALHFHSVSPADSNQNWRKRSHTNESKVSRVSRGPSSTTAFVKWSVKTTNAAPTFAWSTKPESKFTCRLCREGFPSRNKLHGHLEITKHYFSSPSSSPSSSTAGVASSFAPVIVTSNADSSKVGSGTAFRDYNYTEIRYLLHPKGTPDWGCMDTGCGMSMIDSTLLTELRWVKRITSKKPVEVRGIGDTVHNSWETVVMSIYLPDESGTKLAKITRELHVVNDLECKLLLGNDIIVPEGIDISLSRRKIRIGSCSDMTCTIRVTPCHAEIPRSPVRAASTTTIPAKSTEYVPIRFAGLKADQDYLFKPYPYQTYLPNDTYVLPDIFSATQEGIFITNVGDKEATVVKGCRIGYISRNDMTTNYWPETVMGNDRVLEAF